MTSPEIARATARPWRMHDTERCTVVAPLTDRADSRSACIADTDALYRARDENEANAALIVSCVNAHASHLATIAEMRGQIQRLMDLQPHVTASHKVGQFHECWDGLVDCKCEIATEWRRARALLARTEAK